MCSLSMNLSNDALKCSWQQWVWDLGEKYQKRSFGFELRWSGKSDLGLGEKGCDMWHLLISCCKYSQHGQFQVTKRVCKIPDYLLFSFLQLVPAGLPALISSETLAEPEKERKEIFSPQRYPLPRIHWVCSFAVNPHFWEPLHTSHLSAVKWKT